MSKVKSKEEISGHIDNSLNKLNSLLNSYLESDEYSVISKADKLSYWIEDYTKFLTYEPNFKPDKLKRYKRGEIIKVHLGYKIGSEEGGLHYCAVLDKNNSIKNPTITVIPLTSLKEHVDIHNLPLGSVYLGNSLYTAMFAKLSLLENIQKEKLDDLTQKVTELATQITASSSNELADKFKTLIDNHKKEIVAIRMQQRFIEKVKKESIKMNKGSIALVSQITTISKLRIYDPKTNFDILSKIKLSNENLDSIDYEIKKLFLR